MTLACVKKTMSLLIFILLFISNINAQKRKEGIDLVNEYSTKVVDANEIVYYGWDFSHVKLFDGDYMGNSEDDLKSRIGSIIGLLSERYTPKEMSKLLNKDIVSDMDNIQRKYIERDYSNLVSFTNFEMKLTDIENIINSYDLSQKSGIGLVIIAECMNKPDKFTTGYVTFFNLENKSLLWVTKMKGRPDRKSKFSKEWFYGFEETILYWIPEFYEPKIKEIKKAKKKERKKH